MKVKNRDIQYFKNSKGKLPFKDWQSKLKDNTAKAKIDVRIRRAGMGNLGDYRNVGESITELRIHYGSGYRVYLSIVNNDEIIILLAGGDKSSQKRDIKLAKSYFKEWRTENE